MSTTTIEIKTTCPYCACTNNHFVALSTECKTLAVLCCRKENAGCGKIFSVVAGKMPTIKFEKINEAMA